MKFLFWTILLSGILSCTLSGQEKINGISFEAPDKEIDYSQFSHITRVNANWVALIPYVFGGNIKEPVLVQYNSHQWWGETEQGISKCIKYADSAGLNTMIKPQIWFSRGEFTGKLNLENWNAWEKSYSEYILTFAKLAQKNKVKLFCIGTELGFHVKSRPIYWKKLILEVKKVYKGKITYAANWDNYQEVSFWNELDFIGVDAYFPLTNGKHFIQDEIDQKWEMYAKKLRDISSLENRKILFTEYGYRNIKGNTFQPWNSNGSKEIDNMAQEKALENLYLRFWEKPWFAGGFLWKWHYQDNMNPESHTGYSPQHKPAEKVVKQYYSK